MGKEVTVHQPASTALQVLNADSDLALVQSAIAENVGVGGITEFDFDRIKIPSGGGAAFDVTTIEGTDAVKSITGVIVLKRDSRAYWEKSIDEGGGSKPPDCHSNDGIVGIPGAMAPEHQCAKCPLAQFGSAKPKLVNGVAKEARGQACKAIQQLFIIGGDSLLPVVLPLPPTSLKAAKQYFLRIAGQGVPYWACVTTIGLEQTKSADGVKYSKATFKLEARLNDQQKAKAKAYHDMLGPLVANMTIDVTDYTEQRLEAAA